MNQFRTVTVLFLRLPHIPVQSIGSSARVFDDVTYVTSEAIRIVSKYGGTCRQIHADEKALSALLIWGVEGFSHEKGDHANAVAAGMEIERLLSERKWWWQGSKGAKSEEPEEVGFSLAVTMGKAYPDDSENSLILVGRESEIKVLGQAVERMRNGEKSLALLVGKSGFGKSHIVNAFLKSQEGKEGQVVWYAQSIQPDVNTRTLVLVQHERVGTTPTTFFNKFSCLSSNSFFLKAGRLKKYDFCDYATVLQNRKTIRQ
ncbi:hypothetical protein HDU97_009928 [Phlyctochytrium planicorne]|nr:hypothetical protein HDU97_009928 [Phlyctochytrium planicorne]